MSDKQARRATKAPATKASAAKPAPTLPINSTDTLGRRLRGGTGALIVGGAVAAVGTLLPWFDVAGGTTVAGVESIAGIGSLVLALTAIAIGVFILYRPDHPAARSVAWGGLVAVMGIAALGVIAAVTTGRSEGVTTAAGLLISFAGGMVATTGCRALLTHP
jgi:hypothetical protein